VSHPAFAPPESTRPVVQKTESTWSPKDMEARTGVHRRPSRRLLNLLFLVEVAASD
jgi:hypothetical protein